MTLTYYRPHISGLTLYASRLAEALARRGHAVKMITSRYSRALPRREVIGGVQVERCTVWTRLGKGVLMPSFVLRCCRATHHCDVVNLHLPQIEAAPIAIYARLVARKPVYTTYHCDLELPPGLLRILFTPLIKLSHFLTVLSSHEVIPTSQDYVLSSRFLRWFRSRMQPCYPPCARLEPEAGGGADGPDLAGSPLIGFVGRFAEEKGVEYIIRAVPRVLEHYPDAVFAFAGELEALGERVYRRLRPEIEGLGGHVRLLGVLEDAELARFYQRCRLLLLPSVNSTESFGMVQVEAMFHGVPVVASDIAGVRVPVAATGMGELVPPRDPSALAGAILRVLAAPGDYHCPPQELEEKFGVERAADFYERLFLGRTQAETESGAALGGAAAGDNSRRRDIA